MSSGLDNLSEWNQQVDNRRAVPEGLPEFSKLLDQSAKVKKQLHDLQSRYTYLKELAECWDSLNDSLGDVCVQLKEMEGDLEDEGVSASDSLRSEPTDFFSWIFKHDPATGTPGVFAELSKGHEDNLRLLPDPVLLRSEFDKFWGLWVPARDELASKGQEVQNSYEPFFLANRKLGDLERRCEWETDSITLPFKDAKTIDACLPDSKAPDTGSFESESAYKLLKYLKTKGCKVYGSADLQPEAAEGDAVLLAPSDGSNSLMTPEISDCGMRSLDNTMLLRHVMPKLRIVNLELARSLQNGSNEFATEAIQAHHRASEPIDAWRIQELLRTAELFKALGDVVQHSLSSARPLSKAEQSAITAVLSVHSTE